MKAAEIKDLFDKALDPMSSTDNIPEKLEESGVIFDFKPGFDAKVTGRLFTAAPVSREMEFVKTLYHVFTRIAVTGVAAILILLLSIFISEGTLSLDSFLGLSDSAEESMVFLLTGI